MSRRVTGGDQEFGSDSFLDIIANIVGILIILIVVAGVKVARQSAVQTPSAPEVEVAEVSPETKPAAVRASRDDLSAPTAAADPQKAEQQSLADLQDEGTDTPHIEQQAATFDAEIADLTLHLDSVRQDTGDSEEELRRLLSVLDQQKTTEEQDRHRQAAALQEQERLATSVFGLRSSLADTNAKEVSFRRTLQRLSSRQEYVSDALQQVAFETRQLREALEAAEQQQSRRERINHRLSPVGKVVKEGELHFRLGAGRIAHIPLEALLERLKAQVMARRNVVMRFHRYEGLVGPVGGFRMQYTVQRQAVSPLQALQYGQSAWRMSVARWTIMPAETLEAEDLDTALRIGSRFRQILESTPPETAVTVWLYPDDFGKFRAIRELAHNLNLRVAARPLPQGTPIAGSPNGSRSTSQ